MQPVRSALRLSLLLIASLPIYSQTSEGAIQGRVVDDKARPLAGFYIVATPQGPGGGLTLTATTDANGAFVVSKAKPAVYTLCAQLAGSVYLDPCRWGKTPQVTVVAGQVAAAGTLALAQGSILRVRVSDPTRKYMNAATAGAPGLMIGVMAPTSLFHALRLVSNTDTEKTFETAIPIGSAVQVAVHGGQFSLADEKGVALAAGAAVIPVQHAAAAANPDLRLTVTGKR